MAELKVLYQGPRSFVEVAGFGRHMIEEIKPYPDTFARELIRTSKRQHFKLMDEPKPTIKKKAESGPSILRPKKEASKNEK